MENGPPDGEQAECHDRLLIDDVDLIAYSRNRNTSTSGKDRSLGNKTATG
jgi:hypothetical protein